MDLLASLVNLGLVAILCVNLAAVSRLRHTLSHIEHRIAHKQMRHAPAKLPAKQSATQANEQLSPEQEELEFLIAAAVAATLKHDRFQVRQITEVTPS